MATHSPFLFLFLSFFLRESNGIVYCVPLHGDFKTAYYPARKHTLPYSLPKKKKDKKRKREGKYVALHRVVKSTNPSLSQ